VRQRGARVWNTRIVWLDSSVIYTDQVEAALNASQSGREHEGS